MQVEGELLKVINNYDRLLVAHSLEVAHLAVLLALQLGEDQANIIDKLLPGALFHDVGKAQIDRRILQKQGQLTNEEWEIVRRHPVYSAQMLAERGFSQDVQEIALYHHERWDGQGYMQIKGEQVPLLAQIVTLADAVQAMATERPYRKGMSYKALSLELKRSCCTQFNPRLLLAFKNVPWPCAGNGENVKMLKVSRELEWLDMLGQIYGNHLHPIVLTQRKKIDSLLNSITDKRFREKIIRMGKEVLINA